MRVLDRIKSGKSAVCDVIDWEDKFQPDFTENKEDTAELLALAERGARYRWVFLKDDKPPETQAVLVHYKAIGYDMVRIASLIDGRWHVEGGNVIIDFDRVVKWMMLPESEEAD